MAKPEFNAGDRVSWNYGVGKGTGHVVERVTKTTKLYGRNFKATPEEPKYRVKSDKGKDVIRNPETLQILKDEGDAKEDAQEEMEDVQDGTSKVEEDDNWKDVIRNPETLQILKDEGDAKEDAQEEMEDVQDGISKVEEDDKDEKKGETVQ